MLSGVSKIMNRISEGLQLSQIKINVHLFTLLLSSPILNMKYFLQSKITGHFFDVPLLGMNFKCRQLLCPN